MVTINTLNGGNIAVTLGTSIDPAKTRFTLQDGTVEEYEISGTIDQQWTIDNEFNTP